MSAIPNETDALLFEILVATAYLRAGWSVAFIPESGRRSPEFEAARGGPRGGGLYVECKRKTQTSDYALRERQHWRDIIASVQAYLTATKQSVVLDIVFHDELHKLSPSLLADLLLPKLQLALPAATIVDDDFVTVRLRDASIERCKNHLRDNRVKFSTLLLSLLFDYERHDRGIAIAGEFRTVGGVSPFVDAIWSCDAEEAIRKKSQSMYRQLLDAAEQIPVRSAGAIHLGIETYDDELLDYSRAQSIVETMARTRIPSNIKWTYFHLMGFQVPPDENWAVDETCHHFGTDDPAAFLEPPLLLADA